MTNSAEVLMPDGALKRQGDSLAPQGVVMRCSRVGGMTVNNVTDTAIGFDTKDFDPYGWLNTGNGRFTPQIAGYYRMTGNVLFTGWPSSSRLNAWFRKNGTTYTRVYDFTTGIANDAALGGTDLVYCNGTTDYIEFGIWHNSGAARSIIGGSQYSFMSAELVGISVGVAPEPWHIVGNPGEPGFQNAWVNYASTDQPMAFYKDPYGVVRLKGIVKNGTVGATIYTLPAGYRPQFPMRYPVMSNNTATYGYVDVAGNVSIISGSNVWADFSPISFRAEQ